MSLTDEKSTHVPYRESKLTRILSESLGGNSKTCLIVTCSPHTSNEAETLNTLRFGSRAKKIKNTPKVNTELTVEELKKKLQNSDDKVKALEEQIQLYCDKIIDMGGKLSESMVFESPICNHGKGGKIRSDEQTQKLHDEIERLQILLEKEKSDLEEQRKMNAEMKEAYTLAQELGQNAMGEKDGLLQQISSLKEDIEDKKLTIQELEVKLGLLKDENKMLLEKNAMEASNGFHKVPLKQVEGELEKLHKQLVQKENIISKLKKIIRDKIGGDADVENEMNEIEGDSTDLEAQLSLIDGLSKDQHIEPEVKCPTLNLTQADL